MSCLQYSEICKVRVLWEEVDVLRSRLQPCGNRLTVCLYGDYACPPGYPESPGSPHAKGCLFWMRLHITIIDRRGIKVKETLFGIELDGTGRPGGYIDWTCCARFRSEFDMSSSISCYLDPTMLEVKLCKTAESVSCLSRCSTPHG